MAKIKISEETWSQVHEDEKKKIHNILIEAGSIDKEDKIVGDTAIPAHKEDEDIMTISWNLKKDLCKATCDVIAATAAAACTAGTEGFGLVACLAAADAAKDLCRDRC
ncbi:MULTISPECIES: hypothetical protein [Bacillus cereus group]|uniref:hypothetical protein n=1 Tax=Bacillus cereus group TaxID=86661 RepID=UPI000BF265E7|nr:MULTISPECIES: hypothetical protein [Bacillus cereus group]PFC29718.1 hypothetical protein CN299_15640 [Bacillus thuringiensis]PFU57499.1 hypothetical protein COK88_00275 [Bacillus cereus]